MARTIICRHCGRRFTANPYNQHHQAYCTAPECQRTRKRLNKQSSRKRLLEGMTQEQRKAFRLNECRRVNRIRHAQGPPATASRPVSTASDFLNYAFKGLVAQLAGTTDNDTLKLQIAKYAESGRAYSAGDG